MADEATNPSKNFEIEGHFINGFTNGINLEKQKFSVAFLA